MSLYLDSVKAGGPLTTLVRSHLPLVWVVPHPPSNKNGTKNATKNATMTMGTGGDMTYSSIFSACCHSKT